MVLDVFASVGGDGDAPALAEVVDVARKPAGEAVHLRVLPGMSQDSEALPGGTNTSA